MIERNHSDEAYGHRWRRPPELDVEKFRLFAEDVRVLLETAEGHGFALAGPHGDGKPEINQDYVAFNGASDCGHPEREITAPWPSDDASGVGVPAEPLEAWYAGDVLPTRLCDGSCNMGPLLIEREIPTSMPVWCRCVTRFRPYDVVVTATLLLLARHLGEDVALGSHGLPQHWYEGQELCLLALGLWPSIPEFVA